MSDKDDRSASRCIKVPAEESTLSLSPASDLIEARAPSSALLSGRGDDAVDAASERSGSDMLSDPSEAGFNGGKVVMAPLTSWVENRQDVEPNSNNSNNSNKSPPPIPAAMRTSRRFRSGSTGGVGVGAGGGGGAGGRRTHLQFGHVIYLFAALKM